MNKFKNRIADETVGDETGEYLIRLVSLKPVIDPARGDHLKQLRISTGLIPEVSYMSVENLRSNFSSIGFKLPVEQDVCRLKL